MQSPPLMTLENTRAESKELKKLEGNALLKRLLEVRLPVFLSPSFTCTDCDEEYLTTNCSFTLIAVPIPINDITTTETDKDKDGIDSGADEKSGDNNSTSSNVLHPNESNEDDDDIANKYDFLFYVGHGKYFEMVDDAYFGKFGLDNPGEITCQARRLRTDENGNPDARFLFTFLPQPDNKFIIQSQANGKYLGESEDGILCADFDTSEKATKFKLVCQIRGYK